MQHVKLFLSIIFLTGAFTVTSAEAAWAQQTMVSQQPSPDFAGEWKGLLRIPGEFMRFNITLKKEAGQWNGIFSVPAQGMSDIAFDTVAVSGDSLFLRLPDGEAEINGRINHTTKSVEGNARFGESSVSFMLARAGSKEAEQIDQEIAENAAPEPSTHPDSARIYTIDITRFWAAYDASTSNTLADVLQSEYFDRGSPGLEDFIFRRVHSAEALARTVTRHPRYFSSARESTLRIDDFKPEIRAAFHQLEELYPDAVYPDVYFLIGRMTTGGTISPRGLLIGAEMFGRTPDMPDAELSDWHQAVLSPVEDVPHMVAHELIHYQQDYPQEPTTLLGIAIHEGVADYVAELISGAPINAAMYDWADEHEAEIWCEFKKEMLDEDTSNWLYNASNVNSRPADLGYYIGYKIAEAYHKQANTNNTEVLHKFFTISDFKSFLEKSKYAQKFTCESGE